MLNFVFWDVQHGSAAYICTPNGKHIAVDLGTGSYQSKKEFSPLLHLKNKYGVKQLDGLIITHPHRDHLDDIFNLKEVMPRFVRRPKHLKENDIRDNNRSEDKKIIDKYLEFCESLSAAKTSTENPFDIVSNGGIKFQQFMTPSCAPSNLNNHSIVTIISYAQSKMIIPGDNEPESWSMLLKQQDFVAAIKDTDILVAPHHGRDSGYSPELFKFINPWLTIISDGRFCDTSATDRYGQKTKGWLVKKRSGGDDTKKCVTTRDNGHIQVTFGENPGNKPFMEVKID